MCPPPACTSVCSSLPSRQRPRSSGQCSSCLPDCLSFSTSAGLPEERAGQRPPVSHRGVSPQGQARCSLTRRFHNVLNRLEGTCSVAPVLFAVTYLDEFHHRCHEISTWPERRAHEPFRLFLISLLCPPPLISSRCDLKVPA